MRCIYCMPSNNTEWFEQSNVLTYEEMVRLARIFVGLGVEKIRVTGGEPTVRRDIEKLISMLSRIEGLKKISMTTNGLLLYSMISKLREAGLASVNISLDTFKADRFKAMAGVDGLDKVLHSIRAADDAGMKVKINTVVMRGWNDDEVVDFAEFSRDTGYTVRFIEFMPLDGTGIWAPHLVFSKKEMIEKIGNDVKELIPLHNDPSEPAMLYSFADGKGTIGFIPSMTEPFCGNCDRIRITSDGRFLGCLFENPGFDLKSLLRGGKSDEEIAKYILECLKKKPEGVIGIIRSNALRPTINKMFTIGG